MPSIGDRALRHVISPSGTTLSRHAVSFIREIARDKDVAALYVYFI
jgi:hypothetical protein